MALPKNYNGQIFGRLTVVSFEHHQGKHRVLRCLCNCGLVCFVVVSNLTGGKTTSCGCYSREVHRKHGWRGSPEYLSWQNMLSRCRNKSHRSYPRYGGRGISVCHRWKKSFEHFLEDMGHKPTPRHTIERRDSNSNYEPSNCYWATYQEQNTNTSRNINIKIGDRTQCLKEWAIELGVNTSTIYARIKHQNMTPREALLKGLNLCS